MATTQSPEDRSQDELSARVWPLVSKALRYICHEGFYYIEFVHVTGRLNFNIDNRQSFNISVSEMLQPKSFLDDTGKKGDIDLTFGEEARTKKGPKKRGRKKKENKLRPEKRRQPQKRSTEVAKSSQARRNLRPPRRVVPVIDSDEVVLSSDDSANEWTIVDLEKENLEEKQKSNLNEVSDSGKILGSLKLEMRNTEGNSSNPALESVTDITRKITEQENETTSCPDSHDVAIKTEIPMVVELAGEEGATDNTDLDLVSPSGTESKVEPRLSGENSTGKKVLQCTKCDYTTDHSRHFKDHMSRHTNKRQHKCCVCHKGFNRPDDLARHLKMHVRYSCPICRETTNSNVMFKTHLANVHPEVSKFHTCSHCAMVFLTEEELEEHEAMKHRHKCVICDESFPQALRLSRHMTRMHPIEALTCNECGRRCSTKGALRKHKMRHREREQMYPCDLCDRSFTAKSTLYHHKRGMHMNCKPYKCTKCDKSFNFHHSIKLHMLQHSGERPYACSICQKTYLTATHLKGHVQAVHGEKKKYKCAVCDKAFPYENSLKMHKMLHTGDKPFMCSQCGRGFIAKSALKVHEATHIEGRRHACNICNKAYKTEVLLKAHQRRHTSDGSRYMCDICGHTFMYESNLQAHAAVHGDERNFVCKECGKAFKTPTTLYSHALVHKEDTPHNCSVCGKGFKTKERRIAHEKRHLGLKPEMCEICGHHFPDKGGLSKHRKTVHAKTKRFACPVCSKQCTRADNLRVHMRVHGNPALIKLPFDKLLVDNGTGIEEHIDYEEYKSKSDKSTLEKGNRDQADSSVHGVHTLEAVESRPNIDSNSHAVPDALHAAVAASGLVPMSESAVVRLDPISYDQPNSNTDSTQLSSVHMAQSVFNLLPQGYSAPMPPGMMAYQNFMAANSMGMLRPAGSEGHNTPSQSVGQDREGSMGQQHQSFNHGAFQ